MFRVSQKDAEELYNNKNNHCYTTIVQINLCEPAPPVKNWRILLVQSFTARMTLLTAASTFGLGRRRWSSPL